MSSAASVDVTVVIPCYNTEKYLNQALSSILVNDRCSLEILVVNDGSTDSSLKIMQGFAQRDDRVRVIDKPNQGYGATVNRGISEARGTYIAIVEPDDWIDPHMYDDLVDYAKTFEVAPDIVKGPYWRIVNPDLPDQVRRNCAYYKRFNLAKQPFTLADCPKLVQFHPSIWSALYRKGFLDECSIRFREVPGAGWVDNPFLFETMCQAKRIVFLDKPYYNYREDAPGSSSATRVSLLPIERWNDMFDVCDRLNVTDLGIRRALYNVGFSYIKLLMREGNYDDPRVSGGIKQMCVRMDPKIVETLDNVSPTMKRMAFTEAGRVAPKFSQAAYLREMAAEFAYRSRVDGFGRAVLDFTGFLDRRDDENAVAHKVIDE